MINLDGYVIRFDDVFINSDMDSLNQMAEFVYNLGAKVIYCISPLSHDMRNLLPSKDAQRIYPKIWNAISDYKEFYKVNLAGLPVVPTYVTRASHGLVHVDHRLLKRSAQEMSIVVSCSLSNSKIFVPPFNKWNKKTEKICKENKIKLIKFEDGWKCMEYNRFETSQKLWYIHHREFSIETFKKWFFENNEGINDE